MLPRHRPLPASLKCMNLAQDVAWLKYWSPNSVTIVTASPKPRRHRDFVSTCHVAAAMPLLVTALVSPRRRRRRQEQETQRNTEVEQGIRTRGTWAAWKACVSPFPSFSSFFAPPLFSVLHVSSFGFYVHSSCRGFAYSARISLSFSTLLCIKKRLKKRCTHTFYHVSIYFKGFDCMQVYRWICIYVYI